MKFNIPYFFYDNNTNFLLLLLLRLIAMLRARAICFHVNIINVYRLSLITAVNR